MSITLINKILAELQTPLAITLITVIYFATVGFIFIYKPLIKLCVDIVNNRAEIARLSNDMLKTAEVSNEIQERVDHEIANVVYRSMELEERIATVEENCYNLEHSLDDTKQTSSESEDDVSCRPWNNERYYNESSDSEDNNDSTKTITKKN